jgi:hypothetical protein
MLVALSQIDRRIELAVLIARLVFQYLADRRAQVRG